MTVRIIEGDCRQILREFRDNSVHCVVTSPPYFGLRDYDVAGQIGLEASAADYIGEIVSVFRDVRRVLREDGTLWLNLGDSYAAGGREGNPTEESSTLQGGQASQRASMVKRSRDPNIQKNGSLSYRAGGFAIHFPGLKTKDLMMMPARVAMALQADGWWLRQDIVWAKPNPMPESVRDRCTKSHEYLFLLSKSARYYFDQDAIAEPVADATVARLAQQNLENQRGSDRVPGKTNGPMKAVGKGNRRTFRGGGAYTQGRSFDNNAAACNDSIGNEPNPRGTRNKRSVWTVATQPFKEAHFATFPPALIEPCILAGCPEGGTVLDPFGGAGTTGLVADRLKRNAILIELNPEYAALARKRIMGDAPLLAEVRS